MAIHTQNKDSSRGTMDCRADFQSARNDNKNAVFQKVDSRERHSASAECMDCRADFQSARNDSKKVDSREAQNPSESQAEAKMDSSTEANLNEPAQDSKIVELESWLFKPHKENKTRGLLTQCGDEIRDSSPQAESLILPPPPLLTA